MLKEFYILAKQFLNLKIADVAIKQDNHIDNEKQNNTLVKTKKVDTKSSLEGMKRKKIG